MTCGDYSWGENPDLLGPLGIDYVYLNQCTFSETRAIFYILAICWVCFMMNILANTASNYFSPTLGAISDKLNLSYDIAGVTFLALGNGAPDFFSLIASFSGGADVLVGVGALLGGGVFVCTVVVGSIAILCPCEVQREVFLRDVSFHLIATCCVTIVAIVQDINFYIAFGLLGVYCSYVVVVLNLSRWLNGSSSGTQPQRSGSLSSTTSEQGIPMTKLTGNSGTLQTAFWHKGEVENTQNKSTSSNTSRYDNKLINTTHSPLSPHNNNNSSSGGYQFQLIKGEDDDVDVRKRSKKSADGSTEANGNNDTNSDDEEEEEEEITFNLSGGYMPDFAVIIKQDYCLGKHSNCGNGHNSYDNHMPYQEQQDNDFQADTDIDGGQENGIDDTNNSSLNTSLLGASSGMHLKNKQYVSIPQGGLKNKSTTYQKAMKSLYWKQKMLTKRFHKSLFATDFSTMSWFERIVFVFELPVTIMRDLTIPTLDDENWSKLYAMLHPICDAIFIAFLFGEITYSASTIPIVLLCILVGVGPSVCIYLLTHHGKAPNGQLFALLWSLTAFVMCIFWIYMLAGELIACLSALGVILKLPPAFLGLTVLAWGNSVGDLFTNTSVAKKGYGEMAIAGCYGGPVFNILMGFGVSLVYACSQSYPAPFSVVLDASSIVSIVFLFLALSSTVLLVSIRQYRIERWFGYYLLGVYFAYTVTQFIVLIFFS